MASYEKGKAYEPSLKPMGQSAGTTPAEYGPNLDDMLMAMAIQRMLEPAPQRPAAPQLGFGERLQATSRALSFPSAAPEILRGAGLIPGAESDEDYAAKFKEWQVKQGQAGQLLSAAGRGTSQELARDRLWMQMNAAYRHSTTELDPVSGANANVTYLYDRFGNFLGKETEGQAKMTYTPFEQQGGKMTLQATQPTGTAPVQAGRTEPGGGFQPRYPVGGSPAQRPGNIPPPPVPLQRGNLLKPPPAGAQEDIARQSQFIATLKPVMDIHRKAYEANLQSLGGRMGGKLGQVGSVVGRGITDAMAGGVYARELVDPAIRSYSQQLRVAAYQYVKAQTGAQFSIREMDRYLSLFPTSLTHPQEAERMIATLVQQAINYIEAMKVRWNAIETPDGMQWIQPEFNPSDPEQNPVMPPDPPSTKAAEDPSAPFAGEVLPRKIFESLPLAEMERFLRGGGTVSD